MSATGHSQDVEVMRAHILARLGIEILEFYGPEELVERWLNPRAAQGKSAIAVAEMIARRFYEKYDLEWIPGCGSNS